MSGRRRLTKDSVKMMSDFMNWVVEWETSDAAPTANEAPKNILFHSAVDDGDVEITVAGANVKGGFCRYLTNLSSC